MINQSLKLVFRNFWARRVYSLVIVLSLITGFVCANVLILFLVFETNTDKFHTKRERIFQLFSNDPFRGSGLIAYIPDHFHNYLAANYGEVEKVCQLFNIDGITIEASNHTFHDFTVLSVDSAFFGLFDFPLMNGRKDNCLAPGKIVLSKEKALTLFGKTDVEGQVVTASTSDTTQELVVSAVVDKPNENSHLTFDALVVHSVFAGTFNGGATYALLANSYSLESLLEKINNDTQRPGLIGPGKMNYFFYPLSESYFNTDNRMAFMKTRNPVFLKVGYIVCGLVLAIASFNFINLFLLFWQNRRKEIGIKKVLGVTRMGLFKFSMIEASVYVVTPCLLSLIIVSGTIPIFNSIFEANLSPRYLLNTKVLTLTSLILLLSCGLVTVLSVMKQWSMKPISLMVKDSSKVSFNKLLFTIQFAISITLAICAITIIRQMHHVENAPLGFNRHIVQLNAPDKQSSTSLSVLKQQISQVSGVHSVTVGGGNPISGNMVARYELDNDEFYSPYLFSGDEDFIKTLGLTLIAGELPTQNDNGKLVNQKLVRQFNLKDPIGQLVPGTTKDRIIGVVEDFTCSSFKQEIPPVIISFTTDGQSLLVGYEGSDLKRILPQLKAAWANLFPDHPFNYRILQEELLRKYKDDTFFYKTIITFSIISMILSCFGLFALSWAVIESRTKEIGIRKVLGATSADILNLLTVTFTKRIVVAFVIAAPIGYYFMNQWLTRFANKIDFNIWIFGLAALIVTLVAVVTLSLQILKATIVNPIDEIRNE